MRATSVLADQALPVHLDEAERDARLLSWTSRVLNDETLTTHQQWVACLVQANVRERLADGMDPDSIAQQTGLSRASVVDALRALVAVGWLTEPLPGDGDRLRFDGRFLEVDPLDWSGEIGDE